MIQAAWAASHTKNTYLSAQYHRIASRRGRKRAIIAVDERKKESLVQRLKKRIEKLGYATQIVPLAERM